MSNSKPHHTGELSSGSPKQSEISPIQSATAGLAGRLADERHSLPLSILLHFLPGILIMAAYVLVGAPAVAALGYPPLLASLVIMSFVLVPAELGLLLYLGWKKNGRPSLEGVVHYRGNPMRPGALAALVAGLLAWLLVTGSLLTPLDTLLAETFFAWVPEQYFVGVGTGEYLSNYPSSVVIVTLLISLILSGLILPTVEELYFRGYLLPRLAHLGNWAPVLNMVLFALYHLWSPWQTLSRIVFFLPTVWATWRKRDLRIALWVHCVSNMIGTLLTLAVVLSRAGA